MLLWRNRKRSCFVSSGLPVRTRREALSPENRGHIKFKARNASRCAACGLPVRQHLPFRTRVHHILSGGHPPVLYRAPENRHFPRSQCSGCSGDVTAAYGSSKSGVRVQSPFRASMAPWRSRGSRCTVYAEVTGSNPVGVACCREWRSQDIFIRCFPGVQPSVLQSQIRVLSSTEEHAAVNRRDVGSNPTAPAHGPWDCRGWSPVLQTGKADGFNSHKVH